MYYLKPVNIHEQRIIYSPENGPTKNLKEVQNDLMGFINADTILVGHGLENDLRLFYKCWCNICLGIAGRSLYRFDDDQDISIKFDVKGIFNSRALQLVHSVVLDTSAVFPHYCGLPYRRSLRSLVSSYLKVSTCAQRRGLKLYDFFSARSSLLGATTPMRMLGPVSISCCGRPGEQFVKFFCLFSLILIIKINVFSLPRYFCFNLFRMP